MAALYVVGFPTASGFKVAYHSFCPTLHWVPEVKEPRCVVPTCAQAQAVGMGGYVHG